MNIATALRPLLSVDGLVAIVVMTQDGLPVEMIGHGLRANVLAAEMTSVAEVGRKCFTTLGMGRPVSLQVNLEKYRAILYSFENHYLAVILKPNGSADAILQTISSSGEQIRSALGGHV
jgi:predicted regulator of Ras-like GTPase activity (Roadblock/LC7/MglB family)